MRLIAQLRALPRYFFGRLETPFFPPASAVEYSREAPLWLLLVPVMLLFIAPWVHRPYIFSGDEPHYLMVANSIVLDGDLELKDDYAKLRKGENRAGQHFINARMDHHTVFVRYGDGKRPEFFGGANDLTNIRKLVADGLLPKNGVNDRYSERTIRAVGWPFLIAAVQKVLPFVKTDFVAKGLSHALVLGAALLIGLAARRNGLPLVPALTAALAVALGSTFWIYANTAFAEPLLGFCLAAAIYCLSAQRHAWVFALALVLGIWTKFQYLPAAVVLLGLCYFRFPRRAFYVALVIFAVGLLGLLCFGYFQYGDIRPPIKWIQGNVWHAIEFFFIYSDTSIFMTNPWMILIAVAPVIALLPGLPRASLGWWLLVAALCAPSILWGQFDGGYCYPGRLIMPVLIPAALYLAHLAASPRFPVRLLCFALLAASIVQNFFVALAPPGFTWKNYISAAGL